MRRRRSTLALLVSALAMHACGGQTDSSDNGAGAGSQTIGSTGAAPGAGGSGGGAPGPKCGEHADAPGVTIDTTEERERVTRWSVGYWTWAPSYGDPVDGSEALIAALKPQLIRIGGYNSDANVPDPFDHAELDASAEYAAATGSELILQLPLIANVDGDRPSASDAAETIAYANLDKGYAIQFASIGNEPDLYPDQGGLLDPSAPAIADYTPEQYCTEAEAFVEAIHEVDPTVQIVGPDLGYKYQSFADWLTPILDGCGELFDVVAIHRYPFESLAVTTADAKNDIDVLRTTIADVRERMASAGMGDKPLAITEANLAYVASPTGNPDGSILGTVEHALWMADFFGVAAELGLWTASIYDIADPDEFSLGLLGLPPNRTRRPAYHAIELAVTPARSKMLRVTSDLPDLRAYASHDANGSAIHLALVHWGAAPVPLVLRIENGADPGIVAEFQVPALSVNSVSISNSSSGRSSAWTYGSLQHSRPRGPEPLELTCVESTSRASSASTGATGGSDPACDVFPLPGTCAVADGILGLACFSFEQLSDPCSATHLLSVHAGDGGSAGAIDPRFLGDGGTEDCPSAEELFWGDAGDPSGCFDVPACGAETVQLDSECCYHAETTCRLR